jgi:hypothetical protein
MIVQWSSFFLHTPFDERHGLCFSLAPQTEKQNAIAAYSGPNDLDGAALLERKKKDKRKKKEKRERDPNHRGLPKSMCRYKCVSLGVPSQQTDISLGAHCEASNHSTWQLLSARCFVIPLLLQVTNEMVMLHLGHGLRRLTEEENHLITYIVTSSSRWASVRLVPLACHAVATSTRPNKLDAPCPR